MDRKRKAILTRRQFAASGATLVPIAAIGGAALAQTDSSNSEGIQMTKKDDIFLLTIRGALKPPTWEESRKTHNMTAGNPDGVAAARALGDLSHNVYVPIGDTAGDATELLIMDLWNSHDGFGQFFSTEEVQAGGGLIFDGEPQRDLWGKAADFASYNLPIPAGREPCCVGLVRGVAKSREAALAGFNQMADDTINAARMDGIISHEIYMALPQPGQDASLEILGVDVWMDAEGMGRFYSNPDHMAPLQSVFAAPPATSAWTRPAGEWIVW